ncbi:unnamed protein product [Tilletia controversa]|uniref:Uncharacterized protein n=3 Tax=Tilletia TaxID=13289 RepID=A0A8X7T0Z4_9BASI|nr:hypothetical protein CF336_g3237 [Tilletia laevis]KAE8204919.1 hypothetical protein CF328_g808 [Tilletia controversa]KAE8265004.1 hypothetical protein A4X03_0g556 [Tilletia caries]KAE8205286.1 hypothetical protein CF335_g2353 [Tilletia laevis]KAE8255106.1 hypothetical protein A4X06_0g591 [Tilletia controversa]
MADLRYLEAWKKQATASSSRTTSSFATTPYNVRLDQPGDGLSYAPDPLASTHNTAKRLFLPASISLAPSTSSSSSFSSSSASIFDFQEEIAERRRKKEANFKLGDYDGDLEEQDNGDEDEDEDDDDYRFDAMSIAAPSIRSTFPRKDSDNASLSSISTLTKSTTTASNLYASSHPGLVPGPPNTQNQLTTSRLPPSISNTPSQTPWSAPLRTNYPALDRLTEEERESGRLSRWEEINERGNVPFEQLLGNNTREGAGDDGASMFSVRSDAASIRTNADNIRVEDLFVPDPRPWRPLRYVRRTDPRQLLLLTHGLLVRDPTTSTLTGGIGVDYCPSSSSEPTSLNTNRTEKNLSHALEVPPDTVLLQSTTLTTKRAAIRAALAALEYADWFEEGFDQVVIGVAHDWLVRGICADIWQWRQDGWVVKGAAGAELGVDEGERVPDRDLWELLDETVRTYEAIDCNVRFWRVNKADLGTAKELAVAGAINDKPQPETVRWRKKRHDPTA